MKITNELHIYEMEDIKISDKFLVVASHWNYSDRVVLKFPDGKSVTVLAKELHAAIDNATNHS